MQKRQFALLVMAAVILGLIFPQAARAATTWTPTVNLNDARKRHTATLLPNGKVLVAGGINSLGNPISRSEYYDPEDGRWKLTVPVMNVPRYYHTATLLHDGKVLVAGGTGDVSDINSCVLYDPVQDTWTATGALNSGRYRHTATLLNNGKVLVVGGVDVDRNIAEIYDPATGQWTSATNGSPVSRYYHTATLLPGGKVLVMGGYVSTSQNAQIYDPDTNSWTTPAAPQQPLSLRQEHTATLLADGRVLIVGGYGMNNQELYDPVTGTYAWDAYLGNPPHGHTATLLPSGRLLITGGRDNGGAVRNYALIYNPRSGNFETETDMTAARAEHTATLMPDGRVLVVGGGGSGWINNNAEIYNYNGVTGPSWWPPSSMTGSLMHSARGSHTATLLPNGKVLVAGGFDGSNYLTGAELFDRSTDTWTVTGSMSCPRVGHTATLLSSGQVLVAGGVKDNLQRTTAAAELYDPASGAWIPVKPMSVERSYHGASLLPDGRVLVSGGIKHASPRILDSAEIYDPFSGAWSTTASMYEGRYDLTSTLLPYGSIQLIPDAAEAVMVVGGQNFDNYPNREMWLGELYLPSSETFFLGEGVYNLHKGRDSHTATMLPNGSLLLTGGLGNDGFEATCEYLPPGGGWTLTGSLATARLNHTATLLQTGKVLVAGGLTPNGITALTELYDRAAKTWSNGVSMGTARSSHTATLLPSGEVLVAGGYTTGDVALASWERYDPGLDYSDAWRPQITVGSKTLLNNSPLYLYGSGFCGLSQGSSGDTKDSSTGYPLVRLQRMDNGWTCWVKPQDFDSGFYMSEFLNHLAAGYYQVTLFANAIPSKALISVAGPIAPKKMVNITPVISMLLSD